ncbi:peptidase domain-containing ABC transporter [Vibrio sp. IRLE0018]|uniref:peptidase domain-containing ABC transporter n=1 Tax=Vibrio floridensis TaxID=2908007 RepID=UPI001F336746|nr:peptidase domain-containing ABC transporter [Vibrio floridensis]MCF8780236.1 peptidase domain-containing ABC transporter [Vibrio floridensis]
MSNPLNLLQFHSRKQTPLIMQGELAECGLACLAMVASYHGQQMDMNAIRKQIQINSKGMNLQQMIELADKLNLASRALKCPLESLDKISTPSILHWDLNHFVVLSDYRNGIATIHDPAQGERTLTLAQLSEHYTGVALELAPTTDFQRQDLRQPMRLQQLWSKIEGFKSSLVMMLLLSLILQLFNLVAPYYMQWVVDEVLISYDQPLLLTLAIGFALVTLISVMTSTLRSYLVLRVAAMLNMQMGVNLLRHLLRLPMDFFENRHIGDIVSRFGSIKQIKERLTTGLVETCVDAIMGITVLAMMLVYSPTLASIVVATMLAYCIIRFALYFPLHRATELAIRAGASEQSQFLETLRGMQTIKLFTRESMRQSAWQNRYAEVINADIQLGKLSIGFESLKKLLFGFENVLVVYFAAQLVMGNALSIGMVLAFVAYKVQFTDRITHFIEQMILFRMLKLHLERISDIALTEQEPHRNGTLPQKEIQGHLELRDIHFRYGDNEKEILSGVNLSIRAGESIAIVGKSGSGKSTLIKLMLGLLQPTKGQILLDGIDINRMGLVHYRQQIAAVMQNAQLLSGSIADNISFFDPQPDAKRMEECSMLAAIQADITAMPMGYNSLVGDMGNQFSGGQIQRLLLARALYQQPKILFMDEATSNLDIQSEALVNQYVKQLPMTRITVAHRPETIRQAERIVVLEQGVVREAEHKHPQPA